jgi:hypothetical protein
VGEAYLIAFASTMTILLTFFVALNALAKARDRGLEFAVGSFVRTLDAFGLPGLFGNSPHPVDFPARSPRYPVGGGAPTEAPDSQGPGGEQVLDFEQEEISHLLQKLRQRFETGTHGKVLRLAVLTLPGRPHDTSPHLTEAQREVIVSVLPPLLQEHGRTYIAVAADDSSVEGWSKGVEMARAIQREIAELAGVPVERLGHLVPIAMPPRPGVPAVRLLFVRAAN